MMVLDENVPHAHSLFYISRSDSLSKPHNKLCNLFNIDKVFCILSLSSLNDLCASSNLLFTQHITKTIIRHLIILKARYELYPLAGFPISSLTCSGCSSPILCLSAGISQRLGWASPVSNSLTPKKMAVFVRRV